MHTNAYDKILTMGVKKVNKEERTGLHVALQVKASHNKDTECGVLLYNRETRECIKRHVFPVENTIGNIRYDFIEDIDVADISYLFFEGEEMRTDPYAGAYMVEGKYGEKKAADDYKAVPADQTYDWEGVLKPHLSYSESIMYCLHVRGFTKHDSAGVVGNGTFTGIIEKLDYLKELGITTLELQPCYEFDELDSISRWNGEEAYRLNYWGYKAGYYYAPKSLYAFSEDPVKEFKDFVKVCHRNHMEVIMQFYFPDEVPRSEIPLILRHWAYHYQVDGFHVKGDKLPLKELVSDPYLADVKLMHHYLPLDFDWKQLSDGKQDGGKRLAIYDESFMYTMRRFLKSDEGMIRAAMECMRRNPEKTGVVNFFSNYYGFTMMDMVSYNRKHNDANGENNQDGVDYNFTWNCGEEGGSQKRNVLKLRKKQLYNAFVLLMLSQGTPLLFMGDEFGHSQSGNNNPYCQDKEITWLNWNDKVINKDLYNFVKSLIVFRKKNKVFHQDNECLMTDYKSVGYPDLSYHNQVAWMPQLTLQSRNIAYMLCGDYVFGNEGELWYVAINMHWEPQEFALPKLPQGADWEKILTTESTEGLLAYGDAGIRDKTVIVAPRSVAVYHASK